MSDQEPIVADTIGELVRAAASRFAGDEALVGGGVRLSYRDVEARSRMLGRRLMRRGVAKGTHVGLAFGNGPDFIVALLAVCRIGAVAIPLSTFARGEELRRLLCCTDIAVLLSAREILDVDQPARLLAALPELGAASEPALRLGGAPRLRAIIMAAGKGLPTWVEGLAAHGDAVDDDAFVLAESAVAATDVALMIHTSGSTSEPKIVPHLHDTLCFRARYLAQREQYRSGCRTYASHVLFWVGGLTVGLLNTFAVGGTSVWSPRFDAGAVLRLIEQERLTRLVIYAHQAEQLLAHPEFGATDLSSLEISHPVMLGPNAKPICTAEGLQVGLGMTETFGPYSWGHYLQGQPTLADIQPGLQVRVVGLDGREVAAGQSGEIVIRGRGVTPGYYGLPAGTGFDADGWFHTGDTAIRDDTVIRFTGRLTELIKTAGANVAPAEVVDALVALDGVAAAHVVGLADESRGQIVAAAVVRDPGADIGAEHIRTLLRRNLSPFKIPTVIVFLEPAELPRLPSGKVSPGELAAILACSAGRSVD